MKQLQKEVSRIKNELVRRLCDLDDILSQIEDEVKETHEDDDATIASIVNNSIYIILRRPVNGVTTISFEYDTEDDAIDALIALSELF